MRFAPSPNGHLHLGHAFAAVFGYRVAKALGGRFLVRIEDIDPLRCNRMYEYQILQDLEWLGLEWDAPPIRQSERNHHYGQGLAHLNGRGLLFPSIMSRKQIAQHVADYEAGSQKLWPRDPDGSALYPGTEYQLTRSEQDLMDANPQAVALRLHMANALSAIESQGVCKNELFWQELGTGPAQQTGRVRACPQDWGDVILKRKDLATSYHLSVVIDDAMQGITHVVRGQDMFYATSVHRLLQTLFGYQAPVYIHHPLVMEDGGRKLSKSDKDITLKQLREDGWSPQAILDEVQVPDLEHIQSP